MGRYRELEALAAIGEAVLTAAAGRSDIVTQLRDAALDFTSDNGVRKALSHMCEDAAEDPDWQLSREAGKAVPGRERQELALDVLIERFKDGNAAQ